MEPSSNTKRKKGRRIKMVERLANRRAAQSGAQGRAETHFGRPSQPGLINTRHNGASRAARKKRTP
jgi:hypothetical protein